MLETVARRAAEMADWMNASGKLPCKVVYKVTAKTQKEISDVVREANYQPSCAGIITWCHTFSPSKMWINGFVDLQKALLPLRHPVQPRDPQRGDRHGLQ